MDDGSGNVVLALDVDVEEVSVSVTVGTVAVAAVVGIEVVSVVAIVDVDCTGVLGRDDDVGACKGPDAIVVVFCVCTFTF